MADWSTHPHILGLGQITYSLGLIKWRSQNPSVSLRMQKTEIFFVGQILEPGTLFLSSSQRVSITQRRLFRGSRTSEAAGGHPGLGCKSLVVTPGASLPIRGTRLCITSSSSRLPQPKVCPAHTADRRPVNVYSLLPFLPAAKTRGTGQV